MKSNAACMNLAARAASLAGTLTVGAAIATAELPSFTLFTGTLGDLVIEVNGSSGDGAVVVGQLSTPIPATGLPAFLWTQATGITSLGDLPGGVTQSMAFDTSLDGSVVVGFGSIDSFGQEAFMWTPGGGMVGMGDLVGGALSSHANGVSDDGAVIVGWGSNASGREAFRWTQATGMVGLGDLPGGSFQQSESADISADGLVIVGQGHSASGFEAFRWTSTGGMVGLGDLPGGSFTSASVAASDDGSVVVGWSVSTLSNSSFGETFRWTQATGMVGLGFLPGRDWSRATAMSGDGSVIVGLSGSGFSAGTVFIWTQADGMRDLQSVLVNDFGLDLQGAVLSNASAVSVDGITISGLAIIPAAAIFQGYVAVLGTMLPPPECPGDANGDKVVNFADITEVLANWLNQCP